VTDQTVSGSKIRKGDRRYVTFVRYVQYKASSSEPAITYHGAVVSECTSIVTHIDIDTGEIRKRSFADEAKRR
jgi:hypothetical protein